MKLKVMTYNIQHGHVHQSQPGRIDLTAVGDVIRAADPDAVGLNEVRGRGTASDYTAQAEELAAYLGYHSCFGRSIYVGGNNPYGNAVVSKYPIREMAVHHIPDPEVTEGLHWFEHRSVTRARIETPEGEDLALYTTHFGLNDVEQELAASTIDALLREERLPFLLMGDFNVSPDHPALKKFAWLNSADPLLDPDAALSFPSHQPEIKIDYLYAAPCVRILSAEILPVTASDHRPLLAEIEF